MGRTMGIRFLGLGSAVTALALAGCGPSIPDSGRGAGFDDYSAYALRKAQSDAAVAARQNPSPAISDEELARAGIPVSVAPVEDAGQTAVQVAAAEPVPAPVPAPAPAAATPAPGVGHGSISDEQDFQAVSARESIQSDKERLAEQRAAYQQVAPEALPDRQGQSDTLVIDFALKTSNAVGQALYRRTGSTSQAKYYRACAKYPSQDVAQEDFLKNGGPEKDKRGTDPDGDGFACFWDPAPFRLARGGAVAAPRVQEVLPGQAAPGTVGADGTLVRTSEYDKTPTR
jgi:hypothetical protein